MTKVTEDASDKKASVIVFKTWHFVVSQVLLFIAIFGAMNTVGANFDKKYYSADKGAALEKAVTNLDSTLKELNKTLVDMRVMFAEEKGKRESGSSPSAVTNVKL